MGDERYNDGEYLSHHPEWHAGDSAWKAGHIARMLAAHGLEPKAVCEVGCGAGEILLQLKEHHLQDSAFVGYEISEDAYAMAKTRERTGLSFVLGDLTGADVAPFDLLMAIDVFEHVEDYIGFLRRLRGKAEWKLFHVPLELTALKVLRGHALLHSRQTDGHLHYFSKETALATLRDAGYTIVDHAYTPWAFEIPRRTAKEQAVHAVRRVLFRLNPDLSVRVAGGCSLLVLAR